MMQKENNTDRQQTDGRTDGRANMYARNANTYAQPVAGHDCDNIHI